ncbi:hypothetical protein [Rhodococcus sp. NPDC060176]|uniref:hypothetical protein n=1 Tax=Rhodococcus sp. NPDC060176 TaxID=3347062 RepID=UPI00364F3425
MLATDADVLDITGYTVNDQQIRRAQGIVEVIAGKPESLVTNETDKHWLKYAVCWQSAYLDNSDVFAQANVEQVKQDKTTVTYGEKTYAVSPLVVEAVKQLSWNKSRSIMTGPNTVRANRMPDWWYW